MNIDDIYTPLEEAKEEIKVRWNNENLKQKVEEYLNNDIPDFLCDSPKAYLARHISSLNFELLRFKELATHIDLDFILSECLEDQYISLNSLKRHLGKLYFYNCINKNGEKVYTPEKVIDFNKSDGKLIKEVQTNSGKKLVDFHHEILSNRFPEIGSNIKDISAWLNRNGKIAREFYPRFLALFIRNGVLFENFLLNDEEKELTKTVIFPAVKMLNEKFGLKPLIVRLLPKESEEDIIWSYYDEQAKKFLGDKGNIN